MGSVDRSVGHQRIDHKFKFKELEYDSPISYQPAVKVSFFFKKLPDVSYEHFYQHYAHVHSDLTLASKSFGFFEIQRYEQFHPLPEVREKAAALGMEFLDYDGCSTLWAKSMDHLLKFFASDEYAGLAADCVHFMDTSQGIKIMAGHDVLIFGKGTPGLDPKDGVTTYSTSKVADDHSPHARLA